MIRRVLKWTVPVDERWHLIGAGRVLHVGCQGSDHAAVQVWTDEVDSECVARRDVRVYATGQPVPEYAEALGSVVVDPLVWHVFGMGPVTYEPQP